MFSYLSRWYQARFSDPQALTLLFILLGIALTIYFAGGLLMPLLVALVLAFLLEWPVAQMARVGISRTAAASLVLILFIGLMILLSFGLIPSIWRQGAALLTDLPTMLDKGIILLQEQRSNIRSLSLQISSIPWCPSSKNCSTPSIFWISPSSFSAIRHPCWC